MRKLFIILLLLLMGCTTHVENVFYNIKVYAGTYSYSYVLDKNYTVIKTTEGIFKIKANPEIPEDSWCYVKVELKGNMHPDIAEDFTAKYFMWIGSEKEYKIYNHIHLNLESELD